jgi:hypothetical protein
MRNGTKVIAIKQSEWVQVGMTGILFGANPNHTNFMLVSWDQANGQGHGHDGSFWNVPKTSIKEIYKKRAVI